MGPSRGQSNAPLHVKKLPTQNTRRYPFDNYSTTSGKFIPLGSFLNFEWSSMIEKQVCCLIFRGPESNSLSPRSRESTLGPETCVGAVLGMASYAPATGCLCYICWTSDMQQIPQKRLLADVVWWRCHPRVLVLITKSYVTALLLIRDSGCGLHAALNLQVYDSRSLCLFIAAAFESLMPSPCPFHVFSRSTLFIAITSFCAVMAIRRCVCKYSEPSIDKNEGFRSCN